MENDKDLLKAYLAGLKKRLSLGVFIVFTDETKTRGETLVGKTLQVRSQRYNKLYELQRNIKQSSKKKRYSFQCSFRAHTQINHKLWA